MRKALHWLDENLLFLVSAFLLVFFPLFPKLPLFDALPGYIVRIRLEDFLVVFTLIIWFIQIVRKKASFGPNPLIKPMTVYLIVGGISIISALYIIPTIPLEPLHVGKTLLHYLRRFEYFSLFFVFFSSVKSIKQVKIYITLLALTVLGVTLYGYGQKYLYWPAFSTMNREFSKGWALYLTQHARVLSTFGGHYDLAAWVMVALGFLWALFFTIQKKLLRIGVFIITAGVFWILILTASRTSFIAYLAVVTVVFGLFAFRNGIKWSLIRWFGVIALSMIVMLSFGDLSDRFTKLLKLDQRLGGLKSLLLQPVSAPPQGDVAYLENNTEAVTSKSDFPPLPMKPSDVTGTIPDGTIATQSASGAAILTQVPRNYSQNALVYDLSTGIRLDALWPRAIAGFKKNPLVGSGYATLTKTQFNEFTEAESTDNDYLRALGETGILGFLAFGWILAVVVLSVWKTFPYTKDKVFAGIEIAMAAGVIGLLVNAVYIDVFEASKVAFSFWSLVGIVLGGIKVLHLESGENKKIPAIPDLKEFMGTARKLVVKLIKSDKTYVVLLLVLAFYVRLYRIDQPVADWHSWRQADTSSVTRNYVRYGINALFPRYDDLSSIASGLPNPQGYRFVEFPLYNIFSVVTDKLFPGYNIEFSGRLTSVFASLGSLLFIYLLTKKYLGKSVALFAAFFFAILPYNIFWSRTILPEPTLVMLTTGMLYFFDKWVESDKKIFWLISVILAACALLVKFTAAFFILPMLYISWSKWGKKMLVNPWLYIYGLITVVPFFVWRWHISHYPEGIPAYEWLFNGNGIRFKGAWFWWLFADRIAKLILGGWGIALLVIGIVKKPNPENRSRYMFHFWLLSLVAYLAVFATGNVQHDYYQVILVPILTIFLGIGADLLLRGSSHLFQPILARIMLVIIICFVLMFGWYQARDLFNINHPEIVDAGQEFDRLIPNQHVKVIAPYGGDTAFLYQTGRAGWPIMDGTLESLIKKGADYYVSTTFDTQTNDLITAAQNVSLGIDKTDSFKIIKQTDKYVIIQLVPDRMLPK